MLARVQHLVILTSLTHAIINELLTALAGGGTFNTNPGLRGAGMVKPSHVGNVHD